MLNDTVYNPTKFIFGKNAELLTPEEIPSGTRVLVVAGRGSAQRTGILDRVLHQLDAHGIKPSLAMGVESNPKAEFIRSLLPFCREENVGFILAVGGGSVIDTAKALAVAIPYSSDFEHLYLRRAQPVSTLPMGVILTVAGSGSESNNSSVITFDNPKRKVGFDWVYPRFVIMNPELTVTVPLDATLRGVFDAMSHIMERYFSPTTSVECSGGLAESLLRTLVFCGNHVLKDPSSYDFRAELMWASHCAMDRSLFMGRKGDWSCHQIAHEIGACTDLVHADIIAALYPIWLEVAYERRPDLVVRFFDRVFGEADYNAGFGRFRDLLESWGLPRRLHASDEKIDVEVARRCSAINPSGTVGNYVRLTCDDIAKMVRMLFSP